MNKRPNKYIYTEEELRQSGLSKSVLNQSENLKKEINSLKKSLKSAQNELEKYRNKPLWKRFEFWVAMASIPYWPIIWNYTLKIYYMIK